MTDSCTTCGQILLHDDGTEPDENNVVATRPLSRKLLPILVAIVGFVGVGGWFLWNDNVDSTGDQEASELLEEEPPSEVSLGAVETRDIPTGIGLGGMVSYLSNEGLVVANFASGEATIFGVQVEPVGFTGRLLLASDGERTYRVDTQNPRALATLSAYGEAAPTNISRIVHLTFEPSNTPGRLSATIMSLDGGIIGDAVPVPVGSQLEVLEHFGMVLVPPTGGTYAFTRDGPELISPHRVVAMGDASRVEVQCDDELVCAQYFVREASESKIEETLLADVSNRSAISLSPDGSYLLSFHEGLLKGLRTDDFSSIPIDLDDADGKAAWARDSSQYAWMSQRGRVLNIARPIGSEVETLDLRGLGLPPASGSTLVLSSG